MAFAPCGRGLEPLKRSESPSFSEHSLKQKLSLRDSTCARFVLLQDENCLLVVVAR